MDNTGNERILGVMRHVLVGTTIKPKFSSDADVRYRWLRGPKLDSVLDATKVADDPQLTKPRHFDHWFVSREKEYTATEEDAMHAMTVEAWLASDNGSNPCCSQIFYVLPKLLDPPARKMLPIETDKTTNAFTFTLMVYNVLAECHCDTDKYYHCPAYAVPWKYRVALIFKEIETLKPDVFCLQELEDGHSNSYQKHFTNLDYDCEYIKGTMSKTTGCGTFFNTKKFKLVKKFVVELDNIVQDSPELQQFPELVAETLRNKTAMITMLQVVDEAGHVQPKYIWVVNCHLYWDPAVPDIKAMQAWYLLRKLHEHQQAMKTELKLSEEQYTTITCGDFNSLPDSMVYELLATQRIKDTIVPKMVKYSSKVEFVSPVGGFESCYKSMGDPVTNFTFNFKGCIDYIWYQPASCKLLEVLENPTISTNADLKQSLETYTALPSPVYPSDHLSLMARFSF